LPADRFEGRQRWFRLRPPLVRVRRPLVRGGAVDGGARWSRAAA